MNSVDPMIFFGNLLFIHQLLCANIDGGEGDDGSEYIYTEEELEYDLEHLLDEPEEPLDLRCAHIVERLLLSDCKTLLEKATRKKYKNLQIFYRELSKTIQFVYEAEKFSLYFSAQQEDNAEPRERLKVFIDKSSIEKAKHILKRFKRVNLTVVVRSYLQNLYDVDLSDTMQEFDFVTDLYLLNLIYEYTILDYEFCNTVQDFIDLEKFPKLCTLKVKHMFVADEFLEKVSNMKLQSLRFIGCTFLTSKDTVQTVQQCKQIEVAFGESYENICFNRCGRFYTLISPLAHKQMIVIKVNINKCVKLRNLAVNMSDYVSIMPSDQIVGGLRYLTLGKMNCDRLLSSFRCYGTTPEYLSIDIFDLKLAVNFLKEINRNELKHLVLICYVNDASNLFNLDFAALKVLEIDAGGGNLRLDALLTSRIQMKKLEMLRINCWCVDEELMQMITKFEMLKHLEIRIANWYFGQKILRKQLSNLKGPIEKLLVSSELTIYELVRSIEPLKTLKEFRIDGRSIRSSFESLANRNYDKCQPAKVDANEQNLMESKNVVYLKLNTLHVSVDSTYEELIKLISHGDFETFADIKKLVIDVVAILSKDNQVSSESSPELLNNLIKNIFETFKQLDVLVFCYKSSCISREEADILREFFSSRCKSLKERCEWSDKCDEDQTIFELYK